MLIALSRLVVPVACPGCGLVDVPLCPRCAARLAGAPYRVEDDAPRLDRLDGVAPLPVWGLAACTGATRDVVVAWKDRDRADLDRPLGDAVLRAATMLAPLLGAVAGRTRLAVVPAPSAPGARLRRGREPAAVLAAAVADGLRRGGVGADVVPMLRRRRRTRDQAGLGARARGHNLAGAVVARRRRPASVRVCLLVDDVLTTGATLAAAESALERVGVGTVGALVLAATPPPGSVTESARTARTPAVLLRDTVG